MGFDLGGAIGGGVAGFATGGWLGAGIGALSGGMSGGAADDIQDQQGRIANLNRESQAASLAEQKRQYNIGQSNLAPFQQAGREGLGTYQSMLASYQPSDLPSFQGQYQDPGEFQGVTNLEQDPGYQFRKNQGLEALDRMMAKGGKRFSGERGIALQKYGQDMASQEYGAAYGRSLQEYNLQTQRAGSAYQRQVGQYGLDYSRAQDTDRQQLTHLGQYANLAASGQQAAGASSTLGANYASATANIRSSGSEAIGNAMLGGAQAGAAGQLGMSNQLMSGLAAYQYNQGRQQQPSSSYYNQPVPLSAYQSGDAYMPAYQPRG